MPQPGRWCRRATGTPGHRWNWAPAESADFEIVTTFDPERVLVDPDVLVLQLRREAAAFDFPE